MKICVSCHRIFAAESGFCPVDGQKLEPIGSAAPPRDPSDARVGTTLCSGRYLVTRRVADGGMGRVYQAVDFKEKRAVALKILHPQVAEDAVSVERFKREFESSSDLPHEYIVEVLAFERTEDGSFALVMEYLEGEELRMLLKREKVLPPERVIRILSQVALGLFAAHQRQVVHRDMKPDNVFLSGTNGGDHVKILDFGSVRDNSSQAKKLTMIGTTIGSPFYMSPEQAQALPSLDHRADVWSVAAIAYECLTGTLPFRAPTGPAILLAILTNEAKPPSEAGAAHHVPKTMDAVMDAALAKTADARIPSVAELVDRIGRAYGLEGSHATWAKTPQAELGAQIRRNLPRALEKYVAEGGGTADLGDLDAAFRGGAARTSASTAPAGFSEDVAMGVPASKAGWIVPVIAGSVVVAGAVIAFLATR